MESRLARWAQHLSRLTCSLRGHDEFLQFEKNRVFLRCVSCGSETPGWSVDRKSSVVRFPGVRRSGHTPATSTRKIA